MSVILEMKTIINVIIFCNSNRPFGPGELKKLSNDEISRVEFSTKNLPKM
jgi:hypothetical protein